MQKKRPTSAAKKRRREPAADAAPDAAPDAGLQAALQAELRRLRDESETTTTEAAQSELTSIGRATFGDEDPYDQAFPPSSSDGSDDGGDVDDGGDADGGSESESSESSEGGGGGGGDRRLSGSTDMGAFGDETRDALESLDQLAEESSDSDAEQIEYPRNPLKRHRAMLPNPGMGFRYALWLQTQLRAQEAPRRRRNRDGAEADDVFALADDDD